MPEGAESALRRRSHLGSCDFGSADRYQRLRLRNIVCPHGRPRLLGLSVLEVKPEIVLFGKLRVNYLLANHADVGNGKLLDIEVF